MSPMKRYGAGSSSLAVWPADRAQAAGSPPRPSARWHLDEMVVRILQGVETEAAFFGNMLRLMRSPTASHSQSAPKVRGFVVRGHAGPSTDRTLSARA